MKMRRLCILYIYICVAMGSFAQADRQYIRTGNRLFLQQDFAKAEAEYRKSLAANPRNAQAMYNLGCALMMQQKDSAAVEQYRQAGKAEQSKVRKAMAYHNMGFICQKNKMYGEAIEAYKESLRNHPGDDETRYNLALCQRLQKKQQQNQQNQQQQDKDSKDKNQDKDKKDQQKKQDQQDKKQNEKQPQQQPQPQEKMSRENAEQLLNAAMQEEKATQQRMKKEMQHQRSRRLQKNW